MSLETMTQEQLIAEIMAARAENAKLKAKGTSLKITEKGGLSLYGLGRFPVTLYKSQWLKLLDKAQEIREFITKNDSLLATKE